MKQRTIRLRRFKQQGRQALYDSRHRNYRNIVETDERRIVQAKLQGHHRSVRLIRDLLNLKVFKGETLRIEFGNEVIARYRVKIDSQGLVLEKLRFGLTQHSWLDSKETT